MDFLSHPPRFLFFTGKGGVGKTSVACAAAVTLADRGRSVLLVSTDPASNLDEVLDTELGSEPKPVRGVPGLFALNIDPEAAARAYRERVVGPFRGVLPEAAVRSIEEQLSGACTVEIAAFDEFSSLLGEPAASAGFDHVVFDTAPTGHTLRLIELPAAWSGFIESNVGGTSCLGPLAGLSARAGLYAAARAALVDSERTLLVLVSRADAAALAEAERTRSELLELGVATGQLVVNGVFEAENAEDAAAVALERRGKSALAAVPDGLRSLPRLLLHLRPSDLVGPARLRELFGNGPLPAGDDEGETLPLQGLVTLDALLPGLESAGRGVILTMGKGGVGKTRIARDVALALARRGHRVHLTTTDPAGRAEDGVPDALPNLRVSRIEPRVETRAYVAEVMASAGAGLDDAGRALLEEELSSPCTEEIAVFRAFARVVDAGEDGFVVIDTAPTGHTLLLLDAAEAYHRQLSQARGEVPEAVQRLLPRLRDPAFTKVLLVTLPEATPVHEARALSEDLERAGIVPFGWVVNQSLWPLAVRDRLLARRRSQERRYIAEIQDLCARVALVPWTADEEPRVELGVPRAEARSHA